MKSGTRPQDVGCLVRGELGAGADGDAGHDDVEAGQHGHPALNGEQTGCCRPEATIEQSSPHPAQIRGHAPPSDRGYRGGAEGKAGDGASGPVAGEHEDRPGRHLDDDLANPQRGQQAETHLALQVPGRGRRGIDHYDGHRGDDQGHRGGVLNRDQAGDSGRPYSLDQGCPQSEAGSSPAPVRVVRGRGDLPGEDPRHGRAGDGAEDQQKG